MKENLAVKDKEKELIETGAVANVAGANLPA
jgi:hypothetical protein